jgi:hypothetical protein
MSTSLIIPEDLEAEINRKAKHLKEAPSTILRLAICAGLPSVGEAAPRPEGYFASAYENYPQERIDLENASAKVDVSSEERDRE